MNTAIDWDKAADEILGAEPASRRQGPQMTASQSMDWDAAADSILGAEPTPAAPSPAVIPKPSPGIPSETTDATTLERFAEHLSRQSPEQILYAAKVQGLWEPKHPELGHEIPLPAGGQPPEEWIKKAKIALMEKRAKDRIPEQVESDETITAQRADKEMVWQGHELPTPMQFKHSFGQPDELNPQGEKLKEQALQVKEWLGQMPPKNAAKLQTLRKSIEQAANKALDREPEEKEGPTRVTASAHPGLISYPIQFADIEDAYQAAEALRALEEYQTQIDALGKAHANLPYFDSISTARRKTRPGQFWIGPHNQLMQRVASGASRPIDYRQYLNEVSRQSLIAYARKSMEYGAPDLRATFAQLAPTILFRMFGSEELADEANRMAGALGQAAAERDMQRWEQGQAIVPPIVKRGARNIGATVPQMVVGGAVGGPYAAIATAMAAEADRAKTEGKDAGLSGKELDTFVLRHAATEGLYAAVFQAVGLGGAETLAVPAKAAIRQGLMQGLKKGGIQTVAELTEENLTELSHAFVDLDINPESMNPENIRAVIADTTVATLTTMGVLGSSRVIQRFAEKPMDSPSRVQWRPIERGAKKPITREQVAAWAGKNPEAAIELARHDSPSRPQWAVAGLPSRAGDIRTQFIQDLRTILREQHRARTVQGVEEEIREAEGRPDLRGVGEEQVIAQPPGEGVTAPAEIPVMSRPPADMSAEVSEEVEPAALDIHTAPKESGQTLQLADVELSEAADVQRKREDEAPVVAPDYTKLTVKELVAEAKRCGLKGYGGKRKSALIEMLKGERKTGTPRGTMEEPPVKGRGMKPETLTPIQEAIQRAKEEAGVGVPDEMAGKTTRGGAMTNWDFSEDGGRLYLTALATGDVREDGPYRAYGSGYNQGLDVTHVRAPLLDLDSTVIGDPAVVRVAVDLAKQHGLTKLVRLLETAAQEAQRKAEEARPIVTARGAGLGGGMMTTERIRDDDIPDAIKVPNEEVERRLQKARGMRKPSFMQRVKDTLRWMQGVTRAQEHIPATEKFASANEFFRLLRATPAMAQDEAVRTAASIADPLGPKQLLLFERHAIMTNLAASLKVGQPLRFGFKSAEEVEVELARLQGFVDRVPAVREAIETRRKIVREITQKLVDYDLLPENALENTDTYYHQMVHFYMMAEGLARGGTRAGKVGRSFQKRRVLGEELAEEQMDYNTSYLESEIVWLTDALMEIRKEELLQQLMDKYDIKPQLMKQAKEQGTTWQALAERTEGVDIFQPEPGNHFYRAFTIPERIVAQLQQDVIDTAELSKDDLREVLAMAGPRRQFVVPIEIAEQLRETRRKDAPHAVDAALQEALRTWKVYTLLNPKRALSYNLRNLTGDLDPLVASDPRLLKFVNQALQELSSYHKGRMQLSPELRAARDLGVVGSGFVAEEVPDIKDLAIFRRFAIESGKTKLPMRPVQAYMEIVKPLTQWREDALRYAAFLGYREQLRQGKVKHYGGSKKAVVQQIQRDMGIDTAAAHLARNLLGDYGNISVAGDWIRTRLLPFWSFQEINLKRVPRLIINAWEAGRASTTMPSGQSIAKTGMVLSAAAGRAILMSRIAWMYGAIWAWNHLVMGGDEEDELTGYDRATPHIILGPNPDGSIRVFRRVGAMGDFLEWFGINEAIAMMGKRRAGQVETSDILWEMAFATPEKVLNSLRPDAKALFEISTGQSLFPEPFRPRAVRRGEAAAHIFGLQDEYRWMKGKTLGDGSTARPHYWQRMFWGVVDPRHAALSQTYDLRADFLKKKGKESKGVFSVSRYKEARDAAMFEDYDAFVAWKRGYVEERGDKAKKDFKGWLRTLDPIGSLPDSDELEFATEFLTNEQRQRLRVATNYAHELQDLLVTWWDADERSPEMRTAVLYSAMRKLDPIRPERKDYDTIEKYKEALAKFQAGNARAKKDIRSFASTYPEARQQLQNYFNEEQGGICPKSDPRTLKPSYRAKLRVLKQLYGQ